jgi:hypothetical protein
MVVASLTGCLYALRATVRRRDDSVQSTNSKSARSRVSLLLIITVGEARLTLVLRLLVARGMNAPRTLALACLCAATAVASACGPPGATQPPKPGALTLNLRPTPPTRSGLTVHGGAMKLEQLSVFGDVAPDPRGMLSDATVPWASGLALTFTELPPGLYSRVRFSVDEIAIEGTFDGAPLRVNLELEGLRVDLRSPTGVELSPGHDAALTVTIAAGGWLDGVALESAERDGGEIRLDENHNRDLLDDIAARIGAASFSLGDPIQ